MHERGMAIALAALKAARPGQQDIAADTELSLDSLELVLVFLELQQLTGATPDELFGLQLETVRTLDELAVVLHSRF